MLRSPRLGRDEPDCTRQVQIVAWLGALVISVLVGFSRVYLGVHWTSDVVSGWFVGTAWLAVTIAACALIESLRTTHRRTQVLPGP